MKKHNQVSARQFFIMTFGLYVGTSILVTPAGLAHTAREDAWMASLCGLALNLVMTALYIAVARLYPGKTIFEINEAALGKWPGKAVSLLYLFYFLILTGTLVGNLGFFLTSEMMPETPIEAIQILFLAAAVMCARLGIIILARVGEMLFPFMTILVLVLVLSLVPLVEWNHIKPMLEDGWPPVLAAGFHCAMFQEVIVLLAFFPLVKDKKKGERAYWTGTAAGGAIITAIVLLSVLVLGIEQTENSAFPAFALAKTINVGNFFLRIEGIFITIWVLTFFIKVSLLYLSMLRGLQTVFGLKDQTALIYPLSVLFLIVAWNTYVNTVYIAEIIEKVWAGYALLHLLLFPLLLYLSGLVRVKLRRKGGIGSAPREEAGA